MYIISSLSCILFIRLVKDSCILFIRLVKDYIARMFHEFSIDDRDVSAS